MTAPSTTSSTILFNTTIGGLDSPDPGQTVKLVVGRRRLGGSKNLLEYFMRKTGFDSKRKAVCICLYRMNSDVVPRNSHD